jgi:hypothetical protein
MSTLIFRPVFSSVKRSWRPKVALSGARTLAIPDPGMEPDLHHCVSEKRKDPQLLAGPRFVWLPIVDAYRTICIAPSLEVKAVFDSIRELEAVA